jgi:hypothetical protein
MDSLTLFGLFAVTAMLLFYAFEDRSPWFILAFAVACGTASIYGFLQRSVAVRAGRSGVGCGRAEALEKQSLKVINSFRGGQRKAVISLFAIALDSVCDG